MDVFKAFVVKRPEPTEAEVQNFCADKGYDANWVREFLSDLGYVLHIKSRGNEIEEKVLNPEWKARRWVRPKPVSDHAR